MPVHILTIPFDPEGEVFHHDDLARFLLNKRVKTLQPVFFQMNGRAYWTIFVEYEPILSPSEKGLEIDGLPEPQRALLQKFREWRKEKAEKEGVPVYIIATNSLLVQIVRASPWNIEALRQLQGFGKKKVERYGKEIIEMIRAFYDGKPPHPETSSRWGGQTTEPEEIPEDHA